MKTIELKELTLNLPGRESEPFSYKEQLMQILTFVPDGLTLPEMELAMKVIQKLKLGSNYLNLEDAEHQWLIGRMKQVKWKVISEEVLAFAKAIENAETVSDFVHKYKEAGQA